MRPARQIIFALMLSVCIIMGVPLAPPRRKEMHDIEVKAEVADKKEGVTALYEVGKE